MAGPARVRAPVGAYLHGGGESARLRGGCCHCAIPDPLAPPSPVPGYPLGPVFNGILAAPQCLPATEFLLVQPPPAPVVPPGRDSASSFIYYISNVQFGPLGPNAAVQSCAFHPLVHDTIDRCWEIPTDAQSAKSNIVSPLPEVCHRLLVRATALLPFRISPTTSAALGTPLHVIVLCFSALRLPRCTRISQRASCSTPYQRC